VLDLPPLLVQLRVNIISDLQRLFGDLVYISELVGLVVGLLCHLFSFRLPVLLDVVVIGGVILPTVSFLFEFMKMCWYENRKYVEVVGVLVVFSILLAFFEI
jgi:hypothetical protein